MANAEFHVNRVLEYLARQQAQGSAFYEQAAAAVKDPKASGIFLRLAQDEKKHEAFYQNLAEKYQNQVHAVKRDEMQFLDALFNQPPAVEAAELRATEKKVWDRDQALEIAEHLERDTILFLSQLLSADPALSQEKALSDAVAEKKQHLDQILQLRMDATSSDLML